MSESISNLVALTLQHGRYESRRTIDADECRQLIREWEPQLAFIDLDIYPNFIDVFHREQAVVPTPILAFTRKRDTALKMSAFERGVDDIIELRVKLGDDWRTPQFIETMAGKGYRFKSQAAADRGDEAAK